MATFTPLASLGPRKKQVDEIVFSQFKKELIGAPVVFVGAREKEAKFVAHKSKYLPINSPLVRAGESKSEDKGGSELNSLVLMVDGVKTRWEKVFGASRGFSNFGNTCFMNSALQCLVNTAPLVQLLKSLEDHDCVLKGGRNSLQTSKSEFSAFPRDERKKGEHGNRQGRFCCYCELKKLVEDSYDAKGGKKVISPVRMAQNLRLIGVTFRSGRQEDSHEFLRELLAKCDEEGAKHTRKFFDYFVRPVARLLPGEAPPAKAKPTSLYFAIFGSYLRSRVHCSRCGHNSDTFDPYMDLSIELRGHSLERCLQHFTAPEQLDLDNMYTCGACKRKIQPTKQLQIWQPPNILTIHLKRFNIFGKKVSKEIAYPEVLDLAPYCTKDSPHFASTSPLASTHPKASTSQHGTDPAQPNGHKMHAQGPATQFSKTSSKSFSQASHTSDAASAASSSSSKSLPHMYRLYAVLLHHGSSARSGHYTAVVKASNGVWMDANDEMMSKSSAKHALHHYHDAYILFYARENPIASTAPSQASATSHLAQSTVKKRLEEMQHAFVHGEEEEARNSKKSISSRSSASNGAHSSEQSSSKSRSHSMDVASSSSTADESSNSDSSSSASSSSDSDSDSDSSMMDVDSSYSSGEDAQTSLLSSKKKETSISQSRSTVAAVSSPFKEERKPFSMLSPSMRQQKAKEAMKLLFGAKAAPEPSRPSATGSAPPKAKKVPYDAVTWKANQLYGGNVVSTWDFSDSTPETSQPRASSSTPSKTTTTRENRDASPKAPLSKIDSEASNAMDVDAAATSTESVIGTEGELERKLLAAKIKKMENRAMGDLQLIAKQNKKRSRSAYDIDYDRGKLKKVKQKEDTTPSSSKSYRMHEEEQEMHKTGINKFQAATESLVNGMAAPRSKKETHIKGGADRVKRLQRERKFGKKPKNGENGGKPKNSGQKPNWKKKKQHHQNKKH